MEPSELLRLLMKKEGDNPNSLAAKVKQKTRQPQIYKFLEGISKEPRRATLQPIADHYGIPVEAFYDKSLAQQIADGMKEPKLESAGALPPLSLQASPTDPAQTIRDLARILMHMEEHTRARAATLLSSMTSDPEGPWADWMVALVETCTESAKDNEAGKHQQKQNPYSGKLKQNVKSGSDVGPAILAAEKPVIEGEGRSESSGSQHREPQVRGSGTGS